MRRLILLLGALLASSPIVGCGAKSTDNTHDGGSASVGGRSGTGAVGNGGGATGSGSGTGATAGDLLYPCPADEIDAGPLVKATINPNPAPKPKGGTLPQEGTYALESITAYGDPNSLLAGAFGTVRFRSKNWMDDAGGGRKMTYQWTIADDKTTLVLSNYCPLRKGTGGTTVPYTFENNRLTLFDPNGVRVYKLQE